MTSKLILIVEDDRAILESLVELLEDEGFRVLSAQDGQQALEVLQECRELPSLILLDLMMPRKDGLAFRREQELSPRLSRIPVVLMSADSQVEYKKIHAGLTHHLKKPLSVEMILDTVKRLA